MQNAPDRPIPWRFGVFEVDPASGELRKQGRKIKLPDQSVQILLALVERPGDVVTRQDLRQRLWPGDTFVDFDASLNTAVSLLREALGDSAKNPRFIETLPRRGYRFLADAAAGVTEPSPETHPAEPAAPDLPSPPAVPVGGRRLVLAGMGLALLVFGVLAYRYAGVPGEAFESVAVLPLVYSGPQVDGDQEYLADGMTSALITELAWRGVPNVISETSVMVYKGAKKPLPDIARELGADVLVEGSVQREGNTLRVNAQLIDPRDDRHIWARSYQQEIHSILDLQAEIATAIVRELRPRLVPVTPVERPAAARAVDPRAQEAYLRGRYALRHEVEEHRSRSRGFFEQAIAIDPLFAPAYAGLADYYGFTDALPPDEALSKSRSHALKALELDETLAPAHLALALASMWGDWDWAAAEREFRRSLELDPSDAATRRWYGLFLDLTGRPEEALGQLQRVRSLDPISPATFHALGHHFFLARQYEQALEQIRKAQELSPHDAKIVDALGNLYVYTGAYDRAIAASEQGIALWGRDAPFVVALAVAHARAGAHDTARALLDELNTMARQRHIPPFWFATIYMNLGDLDQAFEWLETAFRSRDVYLVHLRASPQFDPIRSDPRYQDLLRRMEFPQRDSVRVR